MRRREEYLVSRLEKDGKDVPILLRQYLKLNARMIGFNIDPNFGDALMMVDLTTVNQTVVTARLSWLVRQRPAGDA